MDTFEIGDQVVYPNHGVGIIEKISNRLVAGKFERFYLLRICSNDILIMVPMPTNFTLDNNSYYNLTTTAAFSGAVTVCIAGTGELLQYDNGAWVDVTSPGYPTASVTCGTVTSLSPFAVVHSRYSTTIQPPISAGGTSVFNASRGVVPVKFTLTLNGTPTCQLPPATIGVFRINATTAVAVNQSDFLAPSDSGSSFRIDTTNCQYIYNLNSSSLGPGTYLTQIRINGIAVGKGVFSLK